MAKSKVIIVGAGIGGLATAIRLAKKGFDVSIYEKNSSAGGRCQQIVKEGHVFDTGPTMYLFPQIYWKFFNTIGENISDYYDLIRCDPTYRLNFDDNSKLILTSDRKAMETQLEDLEPGSYKQFLKYLNAAKNHLETGLTKLVLKDFENPFDYFNFSNLYELFKVGGLDNHYRYATRFFRNKKLATAFTFQDSYLSLSPFDSPSIFSMFTYTEFVNGSYLPRGGMYKVIEALMAIASKNKVKVFYNSAVKRVVTANNKAIGVELEKGGIEKCDYVIINADISYAYKNLLSDKIKSKKLLGKEYSCSAIAFHWGIDKKLPDLKPHNLYFAKDYESGFRDVINSPIPPEQPHFYIQCPSRIDPSRAPKSGETLTVMVPINHLNPKFTVDWKDYSLQVRKYILKRLADSGIKDLAKHIKFEICHLPTDWETTYNLTYGAVYGLHHNLTQLGYLRESRRHKNFKNLFFVGAGNHPGSGLPTVLLSAIYTTDSILRQSK